MKQTTYNCKVNSVNAFSWEKAAVFVGCVSSDHTTKFPIHRFITLFKSLKQLRYDMRLNSHSRIGKFNEKRLLRQRRHLLRVTCRTAGPIVCPNRDDTVIRCEFDGVAEQIPVDLLQACAVRQHHVISLIRRKKECKKFAYRLYRLPQIHLKLQDQCVFAIASQWGWDWSITNAKLAHIHTPTNNNKHASRSNRYIIEITSRY